MRKAVAQDYGITQATLYNRKPKYSSKPCHKIESAGGEEPKTEADVHRYGII